MRDAVVVTASAGAFPGLVDALRAIPVAAEEMPLMTFAPPLDWGPVDAAARGLGRYRAVAFTSPRAARAFAERLARLGTGGAVGGATQAWVAGEATLAALGDVLGPVRRPEASAVGRHGAGRALAAALLEGGLDGTVLYPCGDLRRDELPARLRNAGVGVDEVVCYRSVLATEGEARRAAERARILLVASPSVAGLLAKACPAAVRPALLAVGPSTASAARSAGWVPDAVAAQPTAEALTAAVRTLVVAG